MTKKVLILSFFLFFITIKLKANADSTKVLFIGNSITYFNDMPYIFGSIANSKEHPVSVSMYAPGGSGILNHYVDPNVYALISNNKWDIIVIQPGTGESAGASNPVDTTVARARIILDSIYYYNPCTKVYLYQIPYGVPSATDYATYFGVQTMIRDSVTKMADALHLQMIPAGECARAYYSMHQNLLLHGSYNDVHPNVYGSYLTALSFYTGIFQDSVAACSYYSTIEQDTALIFFSIVDAVVLNHFANWRINIYNLHAGFTFNALGNSVTFSNLSANYDSLAWDFGDGNTSNALNPNHLYGANGVYPVRLIAYKNTCVDSVQQQITVIIDGINVLNQSQKEITLFPNPVKESLSIKGLGVNDKVFIIDVYGQNVFYNSFNTGGNLSINTINLRSGVYFVRVIDAEGEAFTSKFIKN
ncbi:MAG: T9SS type A sorting domain-containing protein [Bacteroidota bacterium]